MMFIHKTRPSRAVSWLVNFSKINQKAIPMATSISPELRSERPPHLPAWLLRSDQRTSRLSPQPLTRGVLIEQRRKA